jgi:predicted ATPase
VAGKHLYDAERHRSHKYLFGGHDPGVCACGTAAITAWFLGRPDEALTLAQQGADLARELDHPYSRVISLFDFIVIEALRGQFESSGRYAGEAITECSEQHVPHYLAVGHIFAGYSAAKTGNPESGVKEMKRGLQQYRDLGAERLLAPYLLFLADVHADSRESEAALEAVTEAAGLIERTGEVRWAPEIKRVEGEMRLLQSADHADEAEALFREALAVADEQGCRSFELRAATSLARLLRDKADVPGAREALLPVYGTFTEGFGTRDLREASGLIETL